MSLPLLFIERDAFRGMKCASENRPGGNQSGFGSGRGGAGQDCHCPAGPHQDQLPDPQRYSLLVPRLTGLPAENLCQRGPFGSVAGELGHDGQDRSLRRHSVHGPRAVASHPACGQGRLKHQGASVFGWFPGGNYLPIANVSFGPGPRENGSHRPNYWLPDTATGLHKNLGGGGSADVIPWLLGDGTRCDSLCGHLVLHLRDAQAGIPRNGR
ncbi:uncharacterized protein LOC108093338 isoform X5 [Drosophila ficusphila]|uniref:uncharacterized protein LOC108093338 isoform X5 n=1 Tax=Drosophila ficusphila TaxID=30025 RepID=UPI0007E5F2CD|nr:uncharacterized protein LOC108093338 isoform X5 [Drosophila ficusphila]